MHAVAEIPGSISEIADCLVLADIGSVIIFPVSEKLLI